MNWLKDYIGWVIIVSIVAIAIPASEHFIDFIDKKISSRKFVRLVSISIFTVVFVLIIYIVYFVNPAFFNWWNI